MKKVIWGILGTARIGALKVIPAMQKSDWIDAYRPWLNLKADTRLAPASSRRAVTAHRTLLHQGSAVRPRSSRCGVEKIGAEVLTSPDEPGLVRFLDNNRIMVELKAT